MRSRFVVSLVGATVAALWVSGAAALQRPENMLPMSALAQSDARRIVREAFGAEWGLVYAGTQVIREFADDREVNRAVLDVRWDGPARRSRIRFTSAMMAGIEWVTSGNDVWQYDPEQQAWLHTQAPPGMTLGLSDRLDKMFTNYTVEPIGTDRIARERCLVYDILPKQFGNPSRRLYIHEDTRLPLRTENVNGMGQRVNVSYFEHIEFRRSLPGADFRGPGRGERVVEDSVKREGPYSVARAEQIAGIYASEPSYIPDGYEFVGAVVIRQDDTGGIQLQWFDGLSLISLFKQPAGADAPRTGWERFQANAVTWVKDGYYYSLIGDVTPAELSRIRDSVG